MAGNYADPSGPISTLTENARTANSQIISGGNVLTSQSGSSDGGLAYQHVFTPYSQLVGDLRRASDTAISHYKSAEHNKLICGALIERVIMARAAIESFEIKKNEYSILFSSKETYTKFWKFLKSIENIRDFIQDISQVNGLFKFNNKYLNHRTIEGDFRRLIEAFEEDARNLNIVMTLDREIQEKKDREAISRDLAQVKIYLENVRGGITNDKNDVSENIQTLSTLIDVARQQQSSSSSGKSSQTQVAELFTEAPLDANDFSGPLETNRSVQKRKRNTDSQEVAWKEVKGYEELKYPTRNFLAQIPVLKKLRSLEDTSVIRFLGIVQGGAKHFVVTEWAEHGDLKSYYERNRPLKWDLKINFALDICRGLDFLKAVGILHQDVRPNNILITGKPEAKIANFGITNGTNDVGQYFKSSVNNIAYMAPERFEKSHQQDYKCQIYSFGILLWEIAEERTPYEKHAKELSAIQKLVVTQRYREKFSPGNNVPLEWREVYEDATQVDPEGRPALSEVFVKLFSAAQRLKSGTPEKVPQQISRLRPLVTVSMTVQQAIQEHKKKTNRTTDIWNCFNEYSEIGDIQAKYWKGYYLYYNLLNKEESLAKGRMEEAAQLFKEAADNGIVEAQLRYGHCLWRGDGVKKDITVAIDYFQKAAENGNPTAMYNIGNVYFNGLGAPKDERKGQYFLRLAAYSGQPKAVEMCKKRNIHF